MHRGLLPLVVIVLLLTTAAVLASAAWFLVPGVTTGPLPASEETVRQFYDAVNVALGSGDLIPLRAVVAPDFIATDSLPGVEPGKAGLERSLEDLRAMAPGTRLGIEAMVAASDRVMVRVAVHGGQGGAFLRLPLVLAPRVWGPVDLLCVRGGKVVEYRGFTADTGSLREIADIPLQFVGPARRVIALERVTLPPGFDRAITASFGPRALLAERGEVHVEVLPLPDGSGIPTTDRRETAVVHSLLPGKMVTIPAGYHATAMNTGYTDATLLQFSMTLPRPGGVAMESDAVRPDDGTATQTLADGLAVTLPQGPLEAGVGRIVLAPGGTVSFAGADGIVLLSAEAGQVGISVTRPGWIRHGNDGSQTTCDSATLNPTDGALIASDTSFSLQNGGSISVEVLLITVASSRT